MHMLIQLHTFPYPPDTVGPLNQQDQSAQYAAIGTIRNYCKFYPLESCTYQYTSDAASINTQKLYTPSCFTHAKFTGGDEVPPFHTNGAELVKEKELDVRLRNLLMRCLAVEPRHRPLLVELEAWAVDAETNPLFYADIGGDLTSTELADRFVERPSDVSVHMYSHSRYHFAGSGLWPC